MSEFKYACPVCGQHMKCDSSHSGTVMECPTCFQKITAPQAPAMDDPKFIITGTKVGERPVPAAPEDAGAVPAPEKHFPAAVFVLVVLFCAVVAAMFMIHAKLTSGQPNQAATTSDGSGVAAGTANNTSWLGDPDTATIPDSPVTGSIHGKPLNPQTMILNADGLTIRTADLPPEAGVTIYLHESRGNLIGRTLVFKSDAPGAPTVFLRWKDSQGQETTRSEQGGYSMRIEFGQPDGNHLPGKIYLRTPDEEKSYVIGTFYAELR